MSPPVHQEEEEDRQEEDPVVPRLLLHVRGKIWQKRVAYQTEGRGANLWRQAREAEKAIQGAGEMRETRAKWPGADLVLYLL